MLPDGCGTLAADGLSAEGCRHRARALHRRLLSFQAVAWLESLGFCALGEGGAFIEGGQRIARDGELPINTGGGQIGADRLHGGFGLAHEAVVQVRGTAGIRQIAGDPRVAVCTSGGGPLATALLLARD